MHKKLGKMGIVKDILLPSFGRQFFVWYADKEKPCLFRIHLSTVIDNERNRTYAILDKDLVTRLQELIV